MKFGEQHKGLSRCCCGVARNATIAVTISIAVLVVVVSCYVLSPNRIMFSADLYSLQATALSDIPMKAPVRAAFNLLFLNGVLRMLLPVIVERATTITIPPQAMDSVRVDAMVLQDFSMKKLSVALATPFPTENSTNNEGITVYAESVALKIPDTVFHAKVLLSTCVGTFNVTIDNTSIHLPVRVVALPQNGTVRVVVDEAAVDWGPFAFTHKLDSTMCNIAQSIIQFFIGQVDELVVRKVKERLPKELAAKVNTAANRFSDESRVVLAEDPHVTPDRISFTADLIQSKKKSPENASDNIKQVATQQQQQHLQESKEELPDRQIALELPQNSITQFLRSDVVHNAAYVQQIPDLNTSIIEVVFPEAYALCSNCSFEVVTVLAEGPTVSYGANHSIAVEGARVVVAVNMVPPPGMHVDELLHTMRLRGLVVYPLSMALCSEYGGALCTVSSSSTNDTSISLGVFAFNISASVRDLYFAGPLANQLQYCLQPLQDFSLEVLASNMGEMDVVQLTHDVQQFINDVAIPLANLDSPARLPFFLYHGVLYMEAEDTLTLGIDFGLFRTSHFELHV